MSEEDNKDPLLEPWWHPGAHEVVPGVHRVPLPLTDSLRAINAYVLLGDTSVHLIDSGWVSAHNRAALAAGLAQLGAALGDVAECFVTHVHADHYTQAVHLRRQFGTRIRLGGPERESLALVLSPLELRLQRQRALIRELGAERHEDSFLSRTVIDHLDWEAPDTWFDADGETVATDDWSFDVVPTPGHTLGHVVFHDTARGLLFAGDHILPTITPSLGVEPAGTPSSPLVDFLASLARVRRRPDAMLLPAHGAVTASAHARIDELLAHHAVRLDETREAVGAGAATTYDVARALRWTRRGRLFEELPPAHQWLAVVETRAHLEVLELRGEVESSTCASVTHFSPATEIARYRDGGPTSDGTMRPCPAP